MLRATFGATASKCIVCCIDSEQVVGNCDNSVVESYSCQLEAHNETTEPQESYLTAYAG